MQAVTNSVPSELEDLQERHHDLERRLASLERHLALTPDEQVERVRLKKEKLWVKDRMLELTSSRGAPFSS